MAEDGMRNFNANFAYSYALFIRILRIKNLDSTN